MKTDKQTAARTTLVCPYENCKRSFSRANLYREHISIALACPDENHKLAPDPENAVYPENKRRQSRSEASQVYYTAHQTEIKAYRKEYKPRCLGVILSLSNSLHETHSTRQYTVEIVQFLRNHVPKVQRRMDYQTVEIPNDAIVRLLIDVLRLCDLDEQPPQSLDITSGAKSEQFLEKGIAALFALERDPSTNTIATPAHATSLWSIPATAEGLQQWSEAMREELARMNPSLIIDEVYTTTMSPAGMFSTWHIDQTWSGTVLVGLDVPKLFIMCPPTERNMEEYDKGDEFGNFDKALESLSKFDQSLTSSL